MDWSGITASILGAHGDAATWTHHTGGSASVRAVIADSVDVVDEDGQIIERVRAATEKTLVPPAGAHPAPHDASASPPTPPGGDARPEAADARADAGSRGTPPVDMAERFFAREQWRSSSTVPLAVLLGMFGAGIAGTALALRFRDSSGR